MHWIVALHIAAMGAWVGSLLALPPLLAAEEMPDTREDWEDRFFRISRFYTHAMTPAALTTIASGFLLIVSPGFQGGWLPLKLSLVSLLVLLHLYCGNLLASLRDGARVGDLRFLRLHPVGSVLVAAGILILVTAKPI
jgi:protoporphyrinogen IX oxidase